MRNFISLNKLRTAFRVATAFLLPAFALAQIGGPTQTVLSLNLKRAVAMALAPNGNYQLQLANESIHMSEARLGQTRSAMLPTFESYITEQNQTLNPQALGLQFKVPIAGFTFPQSVGPFSTFDARIRVTDNILDLGAIRRYHSSGERLQATHGDFDRKKDEIAFSVARAYIDALRAESATKLAEENVRLSDDLLEITRHRESAGKGTILDVTRSRSQLSDDRQRLVVAETNQERTRLELLRLMNIGMDTDVKLADENIFADDDKMSEKDAIPAGMASRADLLAQQKRQEGAVISDKAKASEALPYVIAFADYGALGVGASQSVATHTIGVSLRIPMFDGGRRRSERAATQAEVREEQIRLRDLRDEVELEIRESFESLRQAKELLKDVDEAASLAQDELAEARHRYEAGVTDNFELVEAQKEVGRARGKQIDGLFNYRLALLDVWLSTGTIRTRVQ